MFVMVVHAVSPRCFLGLVAILVEIRQGLNAAGVLAGVCVALPLAHASSDLLFGVSAWDPPTILLAVAFTAALALLASLVPAVRASRANPQEALKAE